MPLPKEKTKMESNYLKKSYLIYGIPKIGKTTVAASFGTDKDKALFFATEPGHKHQEIYKWYVDEKVEETNLVSGEITEVTVSRDPSNWQHFKQCCFEMTKQNDFKILIVDTADNLFSWCQAYVRKDKKIDHESDMEFGKGYDALKTEFQAPINFLAQKGYGIAFLSHAKENDNEANGVKSRYTDSSLPNTAKKVIHALCDYILYFYADEHGNRFIRTKGNRQINAGDRGGTLPEVIKMDAELLIKELSRDIKAKELKENAQLAQQTTTQPQQQI